MVSGCLVKNAPSQFDRRHQYQYKRATQAVPGYLYEYIFAPSYLLFKLSSRSRISLLLLYNGLMFVCYLLIPF